MQILSFSPGQQVTIFLETKDGYGTRTNTSSLPIVSRVLFPGLTLAANYPQEMIFIDTGLYYYTFTLPIGATGVGTYLVDVLYINPESNAINSELYQIIVSAPFGNFSASVGI